MKLTQAIVDRITHWKTRALAAEAALAEADRKNEALLHEWNNAERGLAEAREQLAGIELRFRSRAALVAITREGRSNKFMFARNGQLVVVQTYGTMEDDVAGWKRELLE